MASTVALPPLERSATFRPRSADPEARTIEVTWSTGSTVRRRGHFSEVWDESLDLAGAQLARLRSGAPLLAAHRANGLGGILGVVESATVDGPPGQRIGRATVRFSRRPEAEQVFADVCDGIIRNCSIGYVVHKVDRREREGDVPLITVRDWSPLEISLVAVPADAGAQVRAQAESFPCEVESANMSALLDSTGTPIRSAAPAPAPADPPDPAQAALLQLRGLYAAAAELKLDRHLVDGLLERGVRSDRVWGELVEIATAREAREAVSNPRVIGGIDNSDPAHVTDRAVGALLHRADPGRYALPPEARAYRGMSLVELRRHLLEAQGIHCRSWTANEVLDFRSGPGFHTTSDLPALLLSAGSRLLEDAYTAATSPLKAHSRERSVPDFRRVTMLRVGNISPLELVDEHAEVTRGSVAESGESFAVESYAKIWAFSRQAIVNDDLGALSDWAGEMGSAAAATEAALFVSLLTANNGNGPTLDDGLPLFHATRGNLASPGTAINVTSVAAARQKMREQKGVGGVFPIQVAPVAILTSPAKELEAEQVVVALTPNEISNVNPFSGKLRVEVEQRLSGLSWFLFSENAPFVVAYLNDRRGPSLSSREGFDILGIEFRALLDVAVAVRDYRFVYRNPGA